MSTQIPPSNSSNKQGQLIQSKLQPFVDALSQSDSPSLPDEGDFGEKKLKETLRELVEELTRNMVGNDTFTWRGQITNQKVAETLASFTKNTRGITVQKKGKKYTINDFVKAFAPATNSTYRDNHLAQGGGLDQGVIVIPDTKQVSPVGVDIFTSEAEKITIQEERKHAKYDPVLLQQCLAEIKKHGYVQTEALQEMVRAVLSAYRKNIKREFFSLQLDTIINKLKGYNEDTVLNKALDITYLHDILQFIHPIMSAYKVLREKYGDKLPQTQDSICIQDLETQQIPTEKHTAYMRYIRILDEDPRKKIALTPSEFDGLVGDSPPIISSLLMKLVGAYNPRENKENTSRYLPLLEAYRLIKEKSTPFSLEELNLLQQSMCDGHGGDATKRALFKKCCLPRIKKQGVNLFEQKPSLFESRFDAYNQRRENPAAVEEKYIAPKTQALSKVGQSIAFSGEIIGEFIKNVAILLQGGSSDKIIDLMNSQKTTWEKEVSDPFYDALDQDEQPPHTLEDSITKYVTYFTMIETSKSQIVPFWKIIEVAYRTQAADKTSKPGNNNLETTAISKRNVNVNPDVFGNVVKLPDTDIYSYLSLLPKEDPLVIIALLTHFKYSGKDHEYDRLLQYVLESIIQDSDILTQWLSNYALIVQNLAKDVGEISPKTVVVLEELIICLLIVWIEQYGDSLSMNEDEPNFRGSIDGKDIMEVTGTKAFYPKEHISFDEEDGNSPQKNAMLEDFTRDFRYTIGRWLQINDVEDMFITFMERVQTIDPNLYAKCINIFVNHLMYGEAATWYSKQQHTNALRTNIGGSQGPLSVATIKKLVIKTQPPKGASQIIKDDTGDYDPDLFS